MLSIVEVCRSREATKKIKDGSTPSFFVVWCISFFSIFAKKTICNEKHFD